MCDVSHHVYLIFFKFQISLFLKDIVIVTVIYF